MNNFYIYRHIRLDKNTPFYVGKGKNNRAFKKYSRNNRWHNIVNSVGYKVEIIEDNLTEEGAFEKEIEFIKYYKDLGYCEANFSEGGGGVSGRIPWNKGLTKQTSNKMLEISNKISNKMKGVSRPAISIKLKGRELSDQHVENIRKCRSGTKRKNKTKLKMSISKGSKLFLVYKKDTNEFMREWINKAECARVLKLPASRISRCLNYPDKYKSIKNYIFKYKE